MPLKKGKSKSAMKYNMKKLMKKEGKSNKQAIAIALNVSKRKKKK